MSDRLDPILDGAVWREQLRPVLDSPSFPFKAAYATCADCGNPLNDGEHFRGDACRDCHVA